MKCPNCEEVLVMTERQGVEIDYCPKCRGVWLDKGELDKIIEKSMAAEAGQNLKQTDEKRKQRQYDDDDDDDDDNGGFFNRKRRNDNNENPNRRRGGFLGNLFDFD
ncbi:MAG: zf-TFIIB domain-containing protein [Chitinophagaceae bacterium]